MRILRAISDLPWWTGLPIFLVGNLLIPYGMFGYSMGLMICLIGSWIFSKLLSYNEKGNENYAVIGIPFFAALMFYFTKEHFPFQTTLNSDTLYGVRTILGLFFGLNIFKGFKK